MNSPAGDQYERSPHSGVREPGLASAASRRVTFGRAVQANLVCAGLAIVVVMVLGIASRGSAFFLVLGEVLGYVLVPTALGSVVTWAMGKRKPWGFGRLVAVAALCFLAAMLIMIAGRLGGGAG